MRRELTVLFSPVSGEPLEVGCAFLDLCEREYWAQIKHGYGALQFAASLGGYETINECIDLSGRDDMMQRIARDGDAIWGCDMLWYDELLVELRAALFRDPDGKPGTTLMLVLDHKVTQVVEDDEDARMPFIVFLCRIAEAIGSDWFVCGPYVKSWKPLKEDFLSGNEGLGLLYAVGWKHECPISEDIFSYYKFIPDGFGKTILGYDFWAKFSWSDVRISDINP